MKVLVCYEIRDCSRVVVGDCVVGISKLTAEIIDELRGVVRTYANDSLDNKMAETATLVFRSIVPLTD